MMTSGRRARISSVVACTDCCFTSAKTLSPPAAVEHVVQEAEAAAGVDAAQRERSRPKTSSVRGRGRPATCVRIVRELRVDVRRAVAARLVAADARAELADRRVMSASAGVLVDEHRDRRAFELAAEIDLALVDDHEVRPERQDALEVGVEQRADARELERPPAGNRRSC